MPSQPEVALQLVNDMEAAGVSAARSRVSGRLRLSHLVVLAHRICLRRPMLCLAGRGSEDPVYNSFVAVRICGGAPLGRGSEAWRADKWQTQPELSCAFPRHTSAQASRDASPCLSFSLSSAPTHPPLVVSAGLKKKSSKTQNRAPTSKYIPFSKQQPTDITIKLKNTYLK